MGYLGLLSEAFMTPSGSSAPNMTTVAQAAGVGKATVSLALRNDPRLRPETCRRVQEVAESLGYKPNAVVANLMAQLRASRTPRYQATLALLNAAEDSELFRTVHTFAEWIRGARERAAQLGYGLDDIRLHEPGVPPQRLGSILESRGIRGCVIVGVLDHGELPAAFDGVWTRFACVVVGVRVTRPPLHFCCNDHFATAVQATEELLSRGFRRPGLVIEEAVDGLVDHRFSAGFHTGVRGLPAAARIPVADFVRRDSARFKAWFQAHKPDAILTLHREVKEWLANLGAAVPRDVSLAHLDLEPALEGWAGMNQNNHLAGASALDVLVGQIHRNETGVPPFAKSVMIESSWVDGKSVRAGAKPPKGKPRKP